MFFLLRGLTYVDVDDDDDDEEENRPYIVRLN